MCGIRSQLYALDCEDRLRTKQSNELHVEVCSLQVHGIVDFLLRQLLCAFDLAQEAEQVIECEMREFFVRYVATVI
jgi:hypothetical protein